MDRLKLPQFVRKAGMQVPEYIRRMMERRHPTVAILWDLKKKRWAMVQQCRGTQTLICWLANAITLANTVYYLDKIHPSNFRSKGKVEDFLRRLDENPEVARIERNSRQMAADGSKDLFNAFNRRVLVPRG